MSSPSNHASKLTEVKTDRQHFFRDDDGQRQGAYKLWYQNGQLMEHSFFVNGKIHGEYKLWYENGNLWVHCFFVNGDIHGEYKRWYENGEIWEHSFYINGNIHGECKLWHDNGQLKKHYICVNGKETDIPIPTTDEERFILCLEHGHMEFIKE